MRINFKLITSILGLLLMLNGIFMLLCLPISLYYNDHDWMAITYSGLITLVLGFIAWFAFKSSQEDPLRKREGYLIVTLGWVFMSVFGTLPYIFSDSIPSFTDAFFETLSGYSTTGASVLTDIEGINRGILFWRSLTQWIGGMGIIVLTVAILPLFGIGGMQLFVAEAPGISPDKLKPRITDTAKRLWLIYCGLTGLECILLWSGGMPFYDSINHSLTTMATGGFSTKNASIAAYSDSYTQYVIIIFMFLAGTNFTINYFGLHGNVKKVWENEEFRTYLKFTVMLGAVLAFFVYAATDDTFEKAFRDTLFQTVSIITTTGFVTADYTAWSPLLTVVFFMLMFIGASAGSTAGGVKVVRHVVLLKNSFLELKRQVHPSAILPVRLNGKAVPAEITFNILAFMIIYLMVFVAGSVIMAALGLDFETAIGSVATCLGNIGPGLGKVGPVDNFAEVPQVGKWVLSLLMLLGRLELFTVLILFTPYFWGKGR